jgi:hypothetical protein
MNEKEKKFSREIVDFINDFSYKMKEKGQNESISIDVIITTAVNSCAVLIAAISWFMHEDDRDMLICYVRKRYESFCEIVKEEFDKCEKEGGKTK